MLYTVNSSRLTVSPHMKIAMVFFSLNVAGGSASVFLSLANALQDQGHEVDVFCYWLDRKRCFPELNKSLHIQAVHEIKDGTKTIESGKIWNRLGIGIDYYFRAPFIYSLLKKKEYDLFFTAEAAAYIPGLLYRQFIKKIPVLWSVFDPISLVDSDRPGLFVHENKWFKWLLQFHNLIDAPIIRTIDKVIVPTQRMKQKLDAFYAIESQVAVTAGIRAEDYTVDHRSTAAHRLKKVFDFKKDSKPLLFSHSHFFPHRRYEDSVEAVAMLVKEGFDLTFLISGSDQFNPDYFQKIKALVQTYNLDKYVLFDTEFKSNAEVIGYYQLADIFLFVSTEQTWGLAPIEALYAGLPTIITDGVGCSEALTNEKHALIIPEKNPTALVQALKKLLKDKKLQTKLSQEGKKLVKNTMTYKSIAHNLTDLFKRFLEK